MNKITLLISCMIFIGCSESKDDHRHLIYNPTELMIEVDGVQTSSSKISNWSKLTVNGFSITRDQISRCIKIVGESAHADYTFVNCE